MKLPLHAVAHGRAGDKGDTSNVSVIAYRAEAFDALVEQVTEDAVLAACRPIGATRVTRYVLPKLGAMNFVIENALDGGVNRSLGIDRHGKTLSFLVLGAVTVEVDETMVPQGSPYLK